MGATPGKSVERMAWTIHPHELVVGLGRVKSVSEMPETGTVCVVFADGGFVVLNENDTMPVFVPVKG